jgi:hypothetical protein
MKKQLLNGGLIAGLLLWAGVSTAQTFTIGANNGSNNTTTHPTPFGDYYKTQRAQYLYTASEMIGAGMSSGDITALAFTVALPYDIADPDGGVMENYTVKIMTTATTSLSATGWEAGASTVWGPTNYIPTLGENTFTFAAPFAWDGSSNIIVEICGGVPEGDWEENGQVVWTTGLGFNGSRSYRSDVEVNVCDYVGTGFAGTGTTRPQIIFTVTGGSECTETPVAGAAASTMESVCADDIFMVSVEPTVAVGITYQWASSPDGVAWTNIVGATAPSYSTTQAAATYYQCTVTCEPTGGSSTSSAVFVDQNAGEDCYCEPTYITGTGDGDYIENVTLGVINNTTGAGAAPFYQYFSDLSTDLEADGSYTITITNGDYTSFNGVAAWIDFNHDGYFDAVTEKLGEATGLGAFTATAIEFNVPADAAIGTTRLRVREVYNTVGIDACLGYTYGETEDYNVNIIPSVCPQVTDLYVDGITENDAVMHWTGIPGAEQYRLILWNTATGIIAKKGVNTTSYTMTDNLTPLTTYAFRIKSVCYDEDAISSPTEWIYWTTLGRIGDVEAGVTLYPNPNQGTFTINVNGYENNAFTLNVINAIGQVVYSKPVDINSADYTETISLNNVTPGMYQVNLSNASQNINYSIIVTE